MQKALQTRRQRLRRLRQLRSGTAGKAAAGGLVVLLLLGLVVAGAVALGAFTVYEGYANDLPPDPRTAFAKQVLGPARIYDRNGTLLYEFEDENEGLRNPVSLRDISEWVIKATLATEDASFYDNPGVNVRGLARAGLENFVNVDAGEYLQGSGGSSITQQLVKNVFIAPDQRYERSPDRKMKETVLALELTRRYSKPQILEWYLNQIQYGNRTNGIEAASRRYFGINAKDLNLAQAALLAGLPQAPSLYDPYKNPDAAIARQHEVLDLMVRHGQITEDQAAEAKAEPPKFQIARVDLKAPHWVFFVRDQLIAQFGEEAFKSGGLRVTTTLDLPLNERAEQIVKDKIAYYESPAGGLCQCHNGSLIAIDNNTGEILAMVGSRDYWRIDIEGENNNAIAIKQPGSALKPFVYLAAFMKGWTPATLIYDQPTKFLSKVEGTKKEYFTPVGPLRSYQGAMTARLSLGNSMNTAAVKAAGFVGVANFIDLAHKVGIKSMEDKENYGVSIATGGSNLTLLDLTYAYSVLANNGEMRGAPALGPRYGEDPNPEMRKLDPVAILKVTDANDKVLYEYNESQPGREQVVPSGFAYQITDILKDNDAKRLTYGTPDAQFGMPDKRPVAAKTGTQQGPKEISTVLSTWNFGYTPDLTVGVWVGNQDNKLVNPNLTSASSSLLIWREFMIDAFNMLNLPPKEFPVPKDVKFYNVNGKREPLVDGQKAIGCEDLRQWGADNPELARVNNSCSTPRTLSNCREVRDRDASGKERVTLVCANVPDAPSVPVIREDRAPSTGTGSASQGAGETPRPAATPVPTLAPTRAPTLPPLVTPPPASVPAAGTGQGSTGQGNTAPAPAATAAPTLPPLLQPTVIVPGGTAPLPPPVRPARPSTLPVLPQTDEGGD
jgi:membrane peptidoglycan carboxypeptidase